MSIAFVRPAFVDASIVSEPPAVADLDFFIPLIF
jgi:hypothetical protein